jgi:hypothetical protein
MSKISIKIDRDDQDQLAEPELAANPVPFNSQTDIDDVDIDELLQESVASANTSFVASAELDGAEFDIDADIDFGDNINMADADEYADLDGGEDEDIEYRDDDIEELIDRDMDLGSDIDASQEAMRN